MIGAGQVKKKTPDNVQEGGGVPGGGWDSRRGSGICPHIDRHEGCLKCHKISQIMTVTHASHMYYRKDFTNYFLEWV